MRILIIILVNLAVYYKTLFYDYLNDDLTVSVSNTNLKAKNRLQVIWFQLRGIRYYRKEDTDKYKGSEFGAHLITLLIHISVCLLIYLVFGLNGTSFFTALIFSVLPANHQVAVWISGKSYGVSAAMCLLGFWLPVIFPLAYLISFNISFGSTLFPVVFLNTKFYFIPLVLLTFLFKKKFINPRLVKPGLTKESASVSFKKIILFFRSYGYYFCISLFAIKLGFYHEELSGAGINSGYNERIYRFDKYFWIGIVLFCIFTTNLLARDFSPVAFGLFWYSVNIFMWCNIITLSQATAERYTYLANIGLCYLLASSGLTEFYIGGIIFAYALRTYMFIPAYKNEFWMIEYGIKEFPNFWKWWHERALSKWRMYDFTGAAFDWGVGKARCPYEFRMSYNLAVVLIRMGELKEARKNLDEAKLCLPNTSQAEEALRITEERYKVLEQAEQTGLVQEKDLIIFA